MNTTMLAVSASGAYGNSMQVPISDGIYPHNNLVYHGPGYPDYMAFFAVVIAVLVFGALFKALSALRPGKSDAQRKQARHLILYCVYGIIAALVLFFFFNAQYFSDLLSPTHIYNNTLYPPTSFPT